jgi:hypothetical protein
VNVRTDPTDNGGLFVGRRPGTAPVRYRGVPERGGRRRRVVDALVAGAVLAVMIVICLAYWGPIPAGGLWIASQVQYQTDNLAIGLLVGFIALLVALFGGLALLKRIDAFWILVRRAAGHDQRQGALRIIFPVTAVLGSSAFTIWLVFIGGLGPTSTPG